MDDVKTQTEAEESWRRAAIRLPARLQPIVDQLHDVGIALTDVDALEMRSDFDDLVRTTNRMMEGDKPGAPWLGKPNGSPHDKTHMLCLYGLRQWRIDQPDVFARAALNRRVLQIANTYLGCFARLYHYDAWLNYPHTGQASGSQLWHRDTGAHSFLKVFVLINDVTAENGAFYYVLGSHPRGPLYEIEASSIDDGRAPRTDDRQMRLAAPDADWFEASGPSGTVIFADTRGYHKGGDLKSGHRLQLTSFYTRRDYERPPKVFAPPGSFHCASQQWATS